MVKSNTFTFNLSDDMWEELDTVSEETGLQKSSIVRRGLHNELKKIKK